MDTGKRFVSPASSECLRAIAFALLFFFASWGFLYVPESREIRFFLSEASIVSMISIGLTLVLMLGSVDFSVFTVFSLCALVAVRIVSAGSPILQAVGVWPAALLAFAASVCLGAACGSVNGLLAVTARIPSPIATFGTLYLAGLLAQSLRSRSVEPMFPHFFIVFSYKWVTDYSYAFMVAFVLAMGLHFAMRWTASGRAMRAATRNGDAARLCGCDIETTRMTAFVLCGAGAGMAAVFSLLLYGNAYPTLDMGRVLRGVAAALVGGASLFRREGSVVNALLGAVIVAFFNGAMLRSGIKAAGRDLFFLKVIAIAIAVDILYFWYLRKWKSVRTP